MQGTVPEKRGVDKSRLRDKIVGAWYGRICGCSLGKPIEGVRNPELGILLRETGNYPMHRYIKRSDLSDELLGRVGSWLGKNMYADISECALADDDTNYTVLYQELIEKYGRDFTSKNVADIWLDRQPKNAYCTAERAAFCNFVKGFAPPASAEYKKPYREWIGAQIGAIISAISIPATRRRRRIWRTATRAYPTRKTAFTAKYSACLSLTRQRRGTLFSAFSSPCSSDSAQNAH